MNKYLRVIPLVMWSGVIIFGSSQGSVSVVETRNLDVFIHKLAHLGEYAILYLLFVYAFFTNRRNYPQLSFIAILFIFLFGLSDEIHQSFTPTRSPRVSDAFVDVCGGVVGYVLNKIYLKKKE